MNVFENLKDRSGWVNRSVPISFQHLTIADFPTESKDRQTAAEAVEEYTHEILSGRQYALALYGPPGSCKTMLASMAWNAIAPAVPYRSSYSDALFCGTADNVAFIDGSQFPDIIQRGLQDPPIADKDKAWNHIVSAYFVVVDDLDKVHPAFSKTLLAFLNARLWTKRLPTIITMNSTPSELAKMYGDEGLPIVSRFQRSNSMFIRLALPPKKVAEQDASTSPEMRDGCSIPILTDTSE